MQIPVALYPNPNDLALVEDLVAAFSAVPVILTDKLTNSVFLNEEAELLFGDDAASLVNRLGLSLLGFGHKDRIPAALTAALLGEGLPWRGMINLGTPDLPRLVFAEASAIARPGHFVAGVIRFSPAPVSSPK
ncbi:hypothetical protein BH09SUM1_BH09SUM1_24530 [soil metagenome]